MKFLDGKFIRKKLDGEGRLADHKSRAGTKSFTAKITKFTQRHEELY
ncbi:hypothetical protein [Leptospira sp. GIMC2001]|nr:hypothetical protein [Leptospira sp. GIMC2001]WCL49052.1 hypothetical protein O4O04_17450 [Leptospira sp. GIMC2001]